MARPPLPIGNQFTGTIPGTLFQNLVDGATQLKCNLESNQLTGSIPASFGGGASGTPFVELKLANNQLSGLIPALNIATLDDTRVTLGGSGQMFDCPMPSKATRPHSRTECPRGTVAISSLLACALGHFRSTQWRSACGCPLLHAHFLALLQFLHLATSPRLYYTVTLRHSDRMAGAWQDPEYDSAPCECPVGHFGRVVDWNDCIPRSAGQILTSTNQYCESDNTRFTCAPCLVDTYAAAKQTEACSACSACTSSQFLRSRCTAIQNSDCSACSSCLANGELTKWTEADCQPGSATTTWAASIGQDTVCSPCTACNYTTHFKTARAAAQATVKGTAAAKITARGAAPPFRPSGHCGVLHPPASSG